MKKDNTEDILLSIISDIKEEVFEHNKNNEQFIPWLKNEIGMTDDEINHRFSSKKRVKEIIRNILLEVKTFIFEDNDELFIPWACDKTSMTRSDLKIMLS